MASDRRSHGSRPAAIIATICAMPFRNAHQSVIVAIAQRQLTDPIIYIYIYIYRRLTDRFHNPRWVGRALLSIRCETEPPPRRAHSRAHIPTPRSRCAHLLAQPSSDPQWRARGFSGHAAAARRRHQHAAQAALVGRGCMRVLEAPARGHGALTRLRP